MGEDFYCGASVSDDGLLNYGLSREDADRFSRF